MASAMNLEYLGSIPIHPDMRIAADTGEPLKNWEINDTMSNAFDAVCNNLVSVAGNSTPDRPTLNVH
jgi:hypothetical protein